MVSSLKTTLRLAAITACTLLTVGAHAQIISDLFNTGVDGSGNKIFPANTTTADLHYTMIANNFGSLSTTTFVVEFPPGSWVQSADAAYIAVDGSDGSSIGGGNYTVTYRTNFTLPGNANLGSVNIAGQWSTDNVGLDILINGFSTGFTSGGFGPFTNFTLPTGHYNTGTNALDFQWQNQGGPGGLDVRFTSKSFTTTVTSTTPEPGSLALLTGLGISGSLFARRRQRRKEKNSRE
jgi:hypothetical protein